MDSGIKVTRETEFYQGFIRFKMSVSNETPFVITNVNLDFRFDDDLLRIDRYEPSSYQTKNGKIILGNIDSGRSKSIAVLFDPLLCSKGTDLDCFVTYKDAQGKFNSAFMDSKTISVVCPMLKTDSDINIGRLKEFIEKLPSKDSKVYEIHQGFDVPKLAGIAREVVEKHDVRHIRTLHTMDGRNCEIWYYGKTKVHKDDIVIRISIVADKCILELFATTKNAEVLTGLLAEIGRDLKHGVEFRASGKGNVINVTIKDSVIQRSNLLDLCDMDGTCPINLIVEDSVIQHSALIFGKEVEDKTKSKWLSQEKLYKQKESIYADAQETLFEWGIEFVYIPAGDFMMGSKENNNEQQVHKVSIKNPFYLGKYPVTQQQWKEVMGNNFSCFKGDTLPVENVSWNDVQEFIKILNEKDGVYKYRLPSEAEWEYASRAGSLTKYSFGDEISKLRFHGWYSDNSSRKTHPVGQKSPNSWGLHDMHGNVWEWVLDNWNENYIGAPSDGSKWENGSSSYKVGKGGGWGYSANFCRSASRDWYGVNDHGSYLGFRVLREI